ncbi:uncharacterized protein LOC126900047 [Daktulosphaira vitifoliae]|uniref:uncharacterized protein LOC126900047 n=1 Tax=Daktulosphaira vitifoliae TaxID=58002 RepID=UPI0021A982BE|nr:uncharacterized protein LOC126900047 [Daktulosphaira vitifoliae]
MTQYEINDLDISKIADDNNWGVILDVDIEYGENLHNDHSDVPLCPENIIPPGSKFKKLIPNLYDKKNYIAHYRTLKQAISLGVKIKKINKVLKFEQSAWMKVYIDLNTKKRTEAKSTFEIEFFKLMINCIYGKCLENPEKRVDVKIITKWENIGKRYGASVLIAKPNFDSVSIFNSNMAAIHLKKVEIVYDRPCYVGFSVLEISKTIIYDFHYNFMKKMYGDKCKLVYTDTDSLCYEIQMVDVYDDMKKNISKFDASNYDPNNVYGCRLSIKKIIGLMKDEMGGKILNEYIGICSKTYMMRSGKEIKV